MTATLLRISDWEMLARQANFEPARMAVLCNVSLRQFERYCAIQFDKSPKKWLVELRCRLGKDLIARGYSTKAAAAELEFAGEAHFCHEFRKLYATSPQTFAPRPSARLMSFRSNDVAWKQSFPVGLQPSL